MQRCSQEPHLTELHTLPTIEYYYDSSRYYGPRIMDSKTHDCINFSAAAATTTINTTTVILLQQLLILLLLLIYWAHRPPVELDVISNK